MANGRRHISLGFTPERVLEGRHICYIFNDEEERRRTMSKYLSSGLEQNEKVLYLVDTMTPDDFSEAMGELGLDVAAWGEKLILSEAMPTYCPDGSFSCPEMLDVVGRFYEASLAEGYKGSRGTGEMSWAASHGDVAMEEVMEYEARLNEVLDRYPYTAVCQYDARLFDGQTILDVLSVHPMMIVRGQLVRNPFFIEPRIFLRQLRERPRCTCEESHNHGV